MKTLVGFFFIVIAISCTKTEDKGILKGNINGFISLSDENDYVVNDCSGITVKLDNETIHKETVTENRGAYIFEDIPYDRYTITFNKDGYVSVNNNITVNHIGGKSPTIIKSSMTQVPTFEIHLDSLGIDTTTFYKKLVFYGVINGATKTPYYSFYGFRCLGSKNYDVSLQSYETVDCGSSYMITSANFVKGRTEYFLHNYKNLDTIYFRVYPAAWGHCYAPDFKKYLGKPSNVIKYVLKNIE